MLLSFSNTLLRVKQLPASVILAKSLSHSLSAASSSGSSSSSTIEQTFPLSPGGLLHICCTQPGTSVAVSNGAEDAVSLQVRCMGSGREHAWRMCGSSIGYVRHTWHQV
jgi:hypothetical protein